MGDTTFPVRLPAVDEWGVPREKMPRCPRCGADEFGMITRDRALCYLCCYEQMRPLEQLWGQQEGS